MLLNRWLEKTLESPLDCKEIKPVNPKANQHWIFIGRTEDDAEDEAPILWPAVVKSWLIGKEPCCSERLNTKREGDDRGQDGWMISLTQRTWVWASSGKWWRIGKPGMWQLMGSQGAGHNWTNEQKQQLTWEFLETRGYCDSTVLMIQRLELRLI